jgi:hypothetical protein
VILDGEVVALDPEGRQDFRSLLARKGNLHYAAFDVLWLNGKDLRGCRSRVGSESGLSQPPAPSSRACSLLRAAAGTSSVRRSDSTLRASSPSGARTPTRRPPNGSR